MGHAVGRKGAAQASPHKGFAKVAAKSCGQSDKCLETHQRATLQVAQIDSTCLGRRHIGAGRTTSQTRYQIFVSSTYEDLREERQQATQAILEAGCFPSGMELFPASDETQWDLIQRVIEESDYYVVVVGGRYGSIGPIGNSFTEMEYDFAVEKGIPVLGFVKTGINELPWKNVEADAEARKKLDRLGLRSWKERAASSATRMSWVWQL